MQHTPPPPRHADVVASPHDAWRTWLAWVALVLLTLTVAGMQWSRGGWLSPDPGGAGAAAAPIEPPDPQQVLMGRMAVGYHQLLGTSPQARQAVVQALDALRSSDDPAAHLRAVMVIGEVDGPAAGLAELDQMLVRDDLPEGVRQDAATLHELYAPPAQQHQPRPPVATTQLLRHHGWFGQLAATSIRPEGNEGRRAVRWAAVRSTIVLWIAVVTILGLGGMGLVLLVLAVVLWATGRLRSHLVAPARTAPFAEAGVLYLGSFAIIAGTSVTLLLLGGFGDDGVPGWLIATLLVLQLVAAPLAVLWPLVRGVGWRGWREGFGITRGAGTLWEIGCGMVGYLAGLPVMAVGLLMTFGLMKLGVPHFQGGHPIVEEVTRSPWWGVALLGLLAAVYAPVTEELMFRGAMYGSLRGRGAHALAAATAVGLVFAAVHPQGLAVVPALTGIAVVFAGIREWRGSLVGPVVAHGVHNAMLVAMIYLLMR